MVDVSKSSTYIIFITELFDRYKKQTSLLESVQSIY